jgi:hypothetical protein
VYRKIGQIVHKLLDARFKLHRPRYADLEAEVA